MGFLRFSAVGLICLSAYAAGTTADLLRSAPLRFEKVHGTRYQWVARGAAYAAAKFGLRGLTTALEQLSQTYQVPVIVTRK